MQGLISARWTASALQALQAGRKDSVIQNANDSVHQPSMTARPSRWLFMFKSCETLLSGSQLSDYKEAAVLAFGKPEDSYDTLRLRVEKTVKSDRLKVRGPREIVP